MKQLFILVFIFSLAGSLCAQKDSVYTGVKSGKKPRYKKERPAWQDNITYGGNIQAYLGNPTFIYLAPTIGYQVTDNLNAGLGVIYNYTSVRYSGYGYSASIFGGHSYVRFNATPNFFLLGQYDKLLQPDYYSIDPDKKLWVDYVMAGFGYSQPMGDLVVMNTSLMYNFTYNKRYSIYPTPVIFQVGFTARIR
jgi:hypothetical protein